LPSHAVTRVPGRLVIMLVAVFAAGACSRPLPEAQSAAAQLYATRCNNCHRVYHPGLMTEKMWETQVARMETTMARSGTPLAPGERAVILDYLRRNAARP